MYCTFCVLGHNILGTLYIICNWMCISCDGGICMCCCEHVNNHPIIFIGMVGFVLILITLMVILFDHVLKVQCDVQHRVA